MVDVTVDTEAQKHGVSVFQVRDLLLSLCYLVLKLS